MTTTKIRAYRVQADSWTVLKDILVGTPQPFNAAIASLRGREVNDLSDFNRGWLPAEYRNAARDAVISYVIYSYETPIAWRQIAGWQLDGAAEYEWVVPKVTYSATTTKHQNKVRVALSQIGDGKYAE